jgi:hypothetical protein
MGTVWIGIAAFVADMVLVAYAIRLQLSNNELRRKLRRVQLIAVARDALGGEVVEGLLSLELDDDDLRMAVNAELIAAGVKDPESYLQDRGILE